MTPNASEGNSSSRVSLVAAALIAVLLAASPGLARDALSATALQAELIDRAFAYVGRENGERLTGTLAYRRDGTILIQTAEGFIDAGNWRIAGGRLCTRLILLRQNTETCFAVAADGPRRYVTSHGYTLRPLDDLRIDGI